VEVQSEEKKMMKRTRIDVEADIIRVAKERGGAKKTWLVYGCNLNFNLIKDYLRRLRERGLLIFREPFYYTTPKADKFLIAYDCVVS